MAEYVNRVQLDFNGKSFSDFESWSDNSVTLHKQVNLMNKTGHAKMTPRYGFSVGVKIPNVPPDIDLDAVSGGTCTVEFGGTDETIRTRITYAGVYTLETGEGSADGETEMTRTKTFGAESKSIENL